MFFDLIGFFVPEQVDGLPWWPLAIVIAALVVLNVINNRVAPSRHYLLWAIGGALGFLALGLLDGNTFTDMGLAWQRLIPGLLWAAACIVVVALGFSVASSFRRGRDAMQDERVKDMSVSTIVYQAFVEVPFGTVLLEEIAFRSVLFSMLVRRYGLVWGIVWSAIIFGLWHVLPSWGTHEKSAALGSVVGKGARGNIFAILLSVFTTAIAGVLFALLRVFSGSVLAPMGLHWATNGLGYMFSWVINRLRRRE